MVGPVNGGDCSCHCTDSGVVTIKGLAIADGVTQWNYGPGSYWRQHYGADAISGIVPNLSATLDKYVLSPGGPAGARPLTANACQPLTITKLLSTDGTVIESATLEGMFCSQVGGTFYTLSSGLSILNAVGLSGGDYLIVGERVPLVEFDSYASNTANKTYYLHAHSQRGGNVLIVTKTSTETITIPYNSTAAEIKTLFEATSDCTAATVTGGPWPLLKVQVDATWSVAGGDIKSVASSATFTAGGIGTGSCSYTWAGPGGGPGVWAGVDSCTTGTATEPSTAGTFNGEVRDGTCVLAGATTRNTAGVAASYDTGTGLMASAVGYEFGRNNYVTPAKMMAKSGSVPTWTTAATLGINRYEIASAANNRVVLAPVITGTAASQTLEAWTVADPWVQDWQLYTNTSAVSGSVVSINVQNDTACVSFRREAFTGGNRAAATIAVSTAVVTEYDAAMVSTASGNGTNLSTSYLHDGSATLMTVTDYERAFVDSEYGYLGWKFHFRGGEVAVNGDEMLLGSATFPSFIGVDSNNYYGMSYALTPTIHYDPPLSSPPALGFNTAKAYYHGFYLPLNTRLASATQWRFRFISAGLGDKYTTWLNWYCSAADITTALLVTFPENTEGTFTNANVYPFGAPSTIINPDFAPLQEGLDIIFAGATGTSLGNGVPSRAYFLRGQIQIEFQSVTQYNVQGLGAWDRTDASIVWQRTFGTSSVSGATIAQPTGAWLRGSFVFAYGPLSVAEV